ncbi:MAG: Multidrug resistance protein MdtH [Anaerolineae bacterium]|nr:Multidrug resistance protein MdtH [Anaerolineae bacterium]
MNSIKNIYYEFPKKFWVVVAVSFIDRVGGTLLFPFFALYITQKFGVGMTQAGIILGIFSIFGLFGGMIGGALADRFGRRKVILFGLVSSALSTLALGLVNEFMALYPLAALIGLLSDIGGPAHGAMIADILPEKQRQEGFGILRVAGNMAWIVGPSIGGFVANKSFFTLFVLDAAISCVVALLFYLLMPETKPETDAGQTGESMLQTFKGYGLVTRDLAFMAFLGAGILMGTVYQQMYNSLSVYLRDMHGISSQGYGFLLTVSAITVILFQFWMMRLIKRRPPFLMMAFGTLFYMVGFGMFGFVSLYGLFALAIFIITVGEMIVLPTSQALVAKFAPEAMRGRYMAVFGLIWMVPATIGPGAAGIILDNYNPNLLWTIGGGICAVSALSFYALHLRLGMHSRFNPAPAEAGVAVA